MCILHASRRVLCCWSAARVAPLAATGHRTHPMTRRWRLDSTRTGLDRDFDFATSPTERTHLRAALRLLHWQSKCVVCFKVIAFQYGLSFMGDLLGLKMLFAEHYLVFFLALIAFVTGDPYSTFQELMYSCSCLCMKHWFSSSTGWILAFHALCCRSSSGDCQNFPPHGN